MKKITIGEKFTDKKFDFRETCFGICVSNDKILLTKKVVKNEIAMVGGGLEKGETCKECLEREFLEETGYQVLSAKPICIIDCYWLAGGVWPMESLVNVYEVELSKEFCNPTEEGHESLWIDFENVENILPLPYHKEAIKQYKINKKLI